MLIPPSTVPGSTDLGYGSGIRILHKNKQTKKKTFSGNSNVQPHIRITDLSNFSKISQIEQRRQAGRPCEPYCVPV